MSPYREPVVTVEECRSCQLKRMRKAARVKWLKVVAWPVVKAMLVALPWCLMYAQREISQGMSATEAYVLAGVLLGAASFFGNTLRVITSKPDVG